MIKSFVGSLLIAFGSRKRPKTNLIFNFQSLFIHSRRYYDSLVSLYEICIFESLSVYQKNSSSRSTDLIFDHRLISRSLDDKNIIEFIFYLKVLYSHFFLYVPISDLHRIFKRAVSVSYNSPYGRDRQSMIITFVKHGDFYFKWNLYLCRIWWSLTLTMI